MNTHNDDGSLSDEVVIHLTSRDDEDVEVELYAPDESKVIELGAEDTRICKCWPKKWHRLINV